MKTNLLKSLLLILLVTCLFGCEKEVDMVPEMKSLESNTINSIKAYLDQSSGDYSGVKRNNYESLLLSLNWNKASFAIEPDGLRIVKVSSTMEVPVSRNGKVSTRQLIISMRGDDVLDAYVLDVIASEAFQRAASGLGLVRD